MGKYHFKDIERLVVYTIHNERCYICNTPIDFKNMEVDHILPENLLDDSIKMDEIIELYKLPKTFSINSYNNWLPSCSNCNNKKRDIIFEPTLLIQLQLQETQKKYSKSIEYEKKASSSKQISKALQVLKIAFLKGILTQDQVKELVPLLDSMNEQREVEIQNEPLRISPTVNIILDSSDKYVLKGPFGIGTRPKSNQENIFCLNCGNNTAWNGNRCVTCGEIED